MWLLMKPELDAEMVAQAILAMPQEKFFRSKSIFEHKWSVKENEELPVEVTAALAWMETAAFDYCAARAGVPSLCPDDSRRYTGVFKYGPRDHLAPHVDAGIHPITGQRKHWTAIMFLGHGHGDLEFWDGIDVQDSQTACWPLSRMAGAIPPDPPIVVLFENHDRAWHGAGVNWSGETRLALTVSYMSDEVDAFSNKRQRAFFVPKPMEAWSPKTFEERDRRAEFDPAKQLTPGMMA